MGRAGCLALVVSACGGGGEEGRREVSGRVFGEEGASWVVCLDENANLSCDAGEASTAAGVDGTFSMVVWSSVALEGRNWVAEAAPPSDEAAGSASVLRLFGPASSGVVSSLTTLAVAERLAMTPPDLAAAAVKVRTILGLADSTDVLAAPSSQGDAALNRAADLAMVALRTAYRARPTEGNQEVSALYIAQTASKVTLNALGRYADPQAGSVLATVGARTIATEVEQGVNPTDCKMEPPVRLYIDTEKAAAIESKETYVKARLRVDSSAADGPAIDVTAQVRGRGNSTWGMPKKPFRIKLDQPHSLLGMKADKDWALLANYADKSLLRNAVAFCLGRTLGMAYTPAQRFVELELNGEYVGVYQLTDHIETAAHRVDIGNSVPTGGDPGGFLLEIDARLDADDWFVTSRMGVPLAFKSDTTPEQVPLVQQLIASLEEALHADDLTVNATSQYTSLLDVESAVDYYLVNELMRNNDAFWSSTFITRRSSGLLTFGPLWDFDIAAGNINYNGNEATEGWWVRGTPYPSRLFLDPVFARHAAARWAFLSERLPSLQRYIAASAATLNEAQARNFQRWDILNTIVWPNPAVRGSYQGEVDYLSEWLGQRAAWMDKQFQSPPIQ